MRSYILLLAALLLNACERHDDDRPIAVSVMGGAGDGPGRSALRSATAQGLVRFDAAGQIEPGLASRWNVIDGGRSYIFRLDDAEWSDGSPVTADQVVATLRRALRPSANHALVPFLQSIDEVVAMTPQVVEVRLSRPQPELLVLLAQPEMSMTRGRGGSGPLRRVAGNAIRLRPPGSSDPEAPPPDAREDVLLRFERPALAVARFKAKRSDMVLGGTFLDWPVMAAADITPANLRIDPAAGLFGFAFVRREGFLAEPLNRAAVAMTLQAAALPQAVDAKWQPAEALMPTRYDSASDPSLPPWRNLTTEQRVATARAQIAEWSEPVRLRIAMPDGPGATLLWGRAAAALIRAGIMAERVGADAPAELRLVDQVAPYDSARWFLATACRPCSMEAMTLIAGARDAAGEAERARLLATADAALAADVAFVAIARPLRWSLVATRLDGFQPNPRSVHPLNHLRNDTR